MHGKEWVQCLHRDDLMSLTLLLYHLLVTRRHLQVTNASKLIDEIIERSDQTVREWRMQQMLLNPSVMNSKQEENSFV